MGMEGAKRLRGRRWQDPRLRGLQTRLPGPTRAGVLGEQVERARDTRVLPHHGSQPCIQQPKQEETCLREMGRASLLPPLASTRGAPGELPSAAAPGLSPTFSLCLATDQRQAGAQPRRSPVQARKSGFCPVAKRSPCQDPRTWGPSDLGGVSSPTAARPPAARRIPVNRPHVPAAAQTRPKSN